IEPGGAGAPARIIHARPPSDVGKRAVAVVMVENVRSKVGDVEVLKSIIIVIAYGDPHAAADPSHAGLLCDVLELQSPSLREQVAEKAVARFPAGWRREDPLLRWGEGQSLNEI